METQIDANEFYCVERMLRQGGCGQWVQDAWGWCTGMTQRDGTGREVGGVQDGEQMYTHG